LFESGRHRDRLTGFVDTLVLGRRQVPDRLEQALVVVPADPLQGPQLDVLDAPPWTLSIDQLGLVDVRGRLFTRQLSSGLGRPAGLRPAMANRRVRMHRLQELIRLHRVATPVREVARLPQMSPNTERRYLSRAGLLDGP